MITREDSPKSWRDFLGRHEGADLEFKSARGGLPGSLWETYSAMANTDGGLIVLGVEDDGETVSGIKNPDQMRKQFWDTVNNRGKVSVNLLTDDDVREEFIEGKILLCMRVPRAGRYQKPVYTGQNPMTGTYRRNYEGDYHCSEKEVSRMLSDRSDEPADFAILEGYGLGDIDEESLKQYRNRFSSQKPDHAWLSEDKTDFLAKLGGWRRDRRTGQEGLTIGGLLMFGKVESIQDVGAIPGYHVDYRERLSDEPGVRWTDRLTIDGTWEANVFQFYQRVIKRLSSDLKLPFQLDDDLFRRGETPVHEAIREALVNALIHADYYGEGGIVVEKYRDRLEVSNPGTLLLSFDQILRGGVSECRNKALQKMFLMIGAGEKAGSGIDTIRQGWRSQHWRLPRIQEQFQPDRVQLLMPMVSLMPEEILEELRRNFGEKFKKLTEEEVQAVVTARVEGVVSNARMREITGEHPSDITQILKNLVGKGFLKQEGQKRWTTYRLPFETYHDYTGGRRRVENSIHSDINSLHKTEDSTHKGGDTLNREGDILNKGESSLNKRRDSLNKDEFEGEPEEFRNMSTETLDKLREIALPASTSGRIKPEKTRSLILSLCRGRFLTKSQISLLLDRDPEGLRRCFLKPMVDEGLLQLRYPDKPKRPDQAYTAVDETLPEVDSNEK